MVFLFDDFVIGNLIVACFFLLGFILFLIFLTMFLNKLRENGLIV